MTDVAMVTVGGGAVLAGIRVDDGTEVWRRDLPGPVVDLTASALGPVTAHRRRSDDLPTLTGWSWAGDRLWETTCRSDLGLRSLRGEGDGLLTLGARPGMGVTCTVYDAATGCERFAYPSPGDLPDRVPRGLVHGVRGPDTPGLFLRDIEGHRVVRLLPDAHCVRAVAGAMVVVDTSDDGVTHPRLIAVDTDAGVERWRGEGGPNLSFDADERHVASVVARPDGLAVVLRGTRTGEVAWQSEPCVGGFATVQLTMDSVLVFVDSARLVVLARATGDRVQVVDEPSSLVYGACLAGTAVIDACFRELRCLVGYAA